MRIVVTGASGNVGTSLLRALAGEPAVEAVLGIARRNGRHEFAKTEWREADIRTADLVALFRGADAVVHLAWLIQPSRDENVMRAVNVDGSQRVFDAVREAGVKALVYASSVGAYSEGPKDRRVSEDWPVGGIATSFYSRHKAAVEHLLDRFERDVPAVRVVRLRPALIFKRDAGSEIRRLFLGPLLPSFLAQERYIPFVPRIARLRFQAVHSHDVGDAYRLAVVGDSRGAFNVAAEPAIDPPMLAGLLGAAQVPLHAGALRVVAELSWRLRMQPTPPGWLDLALGAPLMDVARARGELGWNPTHSAKDAILDLLGGIRDSAGLDTPPLDPKAGGTLRLREFLSGVGRRETA